MKQLIEIRTYTLNAGMSEQFQQVMGERSVPMLLAAGTDVVAARPSLHTPDVYLLIRAYSSLAQRSQSQDEFYASAEWIHGPRDAVMACIDTYTTVVIEADPFIIDGLRYLPQSA
ncbi:NIPSNAP family protein [Undibacterium sp. Jales W-56]|uniref:NIPSNAP family protein n=1 Tax=Undibacterium sp. Jales W-56 TaxID=2897325 RepID=UPI0021CFFE12|nr:NIPSNAP family protein [Undibacterium sp. Jales W-56]MCU6434074.1 NIPSNAP family protein [Undibacterium sp. Jales W-56]